MSERSEVIIQQDVYERIRDVFDAAPLAYRVRPVSEPMAMAEDQRRSGASCFVIGAEKYPEEFYRSIDPDSLIIRYGVGYDHVPVALCRERGIRVAFTPGTLDQSVAEHAVGLMLACARSIPQQNREVKAGNWMNLPGRELAGGTAAVLGFGRIGRLVARMLKTAFGMRIVALDILPGLDADGMTAADRYTTDFAEAVAEADFVSLHMKVTDETRGFIDRTRLEMMLPKAFLVNTARGALVNEADLYDAVAGGRIAGAGLDVFVDEPYVPVSGKDLRTLSRVIMTAHCGSNTLQSNRKMAEACIRNAEAWYRKDYERLILVPEMRP